MKNLEKIENIEVLESAKLNTLIGGSRKKDILDSDGDIRSNKKDIYY